MKIFGNGFIGKKFKKAKFKFKDKYIIYASGISNSKITNKKNLLRERHLIKKFIKKFRNKKIIIYISTMSIADNSFKKTDYVKNKVFIENLIKSHFKKYLIIRLTQIVGKNSNPHTITNFLYTKIKTKNFFYLWKGATRNLIDIDDLIKILRNIVSKKFKKSKTINIYNTYSIKVEKIVKILSRILKVKPKFKLIKQRDNKNYIYKINSKTYQFSNIFKDKNYNKKVLNKYYK